MTDKLTKSTLEIDTAEFGKVTFSFTKSHSQIKFGTSSELDSGSSKKKTSKTYKVTPQESDKILESLADFLKRSKILNPKSQISKLVIYKGQGSFTGLRIAAAVAQALSLAWGVPVKVEQR